MSLWHNGINLKDRSEYPIAEEILLSVKSEGNAGNDLWELSGSGHDLTPNLPVKVRISDGWVISSRIVRVIHVISSFVNI